jgi:hypothetical protein
MRCYKDEASVTNAMCEVCVSRGLKVVLWVDCETYFGPDRRRAEALRLVRERRRVNLAGRPPSLSASMRQLRMRAIDARGQTGVAAFVDRTNAVALLADINSESDVSYILTNMARRLVTRGAKADLREDIHTDLDRAHAALQLH